MGMLDWSNFLELILRSLYIYYKDFGNLLVVAKNRCMGRWCPWLARGDRARTPHMSPNLSRHNQGGATNVGQTKKLINRAELQTFQFPFALTGYRLFDAAHCVVCV